MADVYRLIMSGVHGLQDAGADKLKRTASEENMKKGRKKTRTPTGTPRLAGRSGMSSAVSLGAEVVRQGTRMD